MAVIIEDVAPGLATGRSQTLAPAGGVDNETGGALVRMGLE